MGGAQIEAEAPLPNAVRRRYRPSLHAVCSVPLGARSSSATVHRGGVRDSNRGLFGARRPRVGYRSCGARPCGRAQDSDETPLGSTCCHVDRRGCFGAALVPLLERVAARGPETCATAGCRITRRRNRPLGSLRSPERRLSARVVTPTPMATAISRRAAALWRDCQRSDQMPPHGKFLVSPEARQKWVSKGSATTSRPNSRARRVKQAPPATPSPSQPGAHSRPTASGDRMRRRSSPHSSKPPTAIAEAPADGGRLPLHDGTRRLRGAATGLAPDVARKQLPTLPTSITGNDCPAIVR
jgi:hypothetical protein